MLRRRRIRFGVERVDDVLMLFVCSREEKELYNDVLTVERMMNTLQ